MRYRTYARGCAVGSVVLDLTSPRLEARPRRPRGGRGVALGEVLSRFLASNNLGRGGDGGRVRGVFLGFGVFGVALGVFLGAHRWPLHGEEAQGMCE